MNSIRLDYQNSALVARGKIHESGRAAYHTIPNEIQEKFTHDCWLIARSVQTICLVLFPIVRRHPQCVSRGIVGI
jgi:hypothetical protein